MTAGAPHREIESLPEMAVSGRAERVRRAVADAGHDALVVTRLTNIRWLTGFTGSAGIVALTPDRMTLVTDGRYDSQAGSELAAARVDADVEITTTEVGHRLRAALGDSKRVALEADDVTWTQLEKFQEHWLPDVELGATSGLVAELRRAKDDGEVARIRAAATITDRALADLRPRIEPGISEHHLGLELDAAMRRAGASGPAFETIVVSGPNSALPHGRPGPRTLVEGDLVIIDAGAVVDGYRSDMTRTFVVGEPDDDQTRLLDAVQAAQEAGIAAIGPGVAAAEVDAACRDALGEAGLAERFTHGTGHGVGLDIHELPSISRRSKAVLAIGDVVTVEPGVYVDEVGGVRWEDLVHVTADGADILTRSPKQPAIAVP